MPPSLCLFIVLLTPIFVIFLKFLSCFFGGLQKSRTFALAKREQPPAILEASSFALKERVL